MPDVETQTDEVLDVILDGYITQEDNESEVEETKNYVIGVDPGYRNFAICVYDISEKKFKYMKVVDITEINGINVTPQAQFMPRLVVRYLNSHFSYYFNNASIVIVENQLSNVQSAISWSVQAYAESCGAKAFNVSPRTIKKYFGTAGGTYKKNKELCVKKFQLLVKDSQQLLDEVEQAKIDDVCDAGLMCLHGVENIEEYEKKWNDYLVTPAKQKPKKKRKKK